MEIKPSGSQPSGKGPAENFTGSVCIDPLVQAPGPARAVGASVTFEPGARTAWHTHPLGQNLIVTAGCGLVQSWAGPIKEIRSYRRSGAAVIVDDKRNLFLPPIAIDSDYK
jgi:quercetin dioxygenase-like cupin family protein